MLRFLETLRQKTFLQIFTIYLRYLIGGAFIIAAFGMGKVSGEANLIGSQDKPIEQLEPISQFFRVMIDSGLYWQFIGWSQIIAGVLLMTQRFSRLGALIFSGIILNIFVITISYDFKGTPVITGLMLLAITYLLAWDLHAFMPLFKNQFNYAPARLRVADSSYWSWLGVIMVASVVILAIASGNIMWELGVPFVEGLIGFVVFFVRRRNMLSVA